MKNYVLAVTVSMSVAALFAGCGESPGSNSSPSATAANVDASLYKLTDEPDGAVGVIAAHELAEDGAPLVLVGRIGGAANPWVEGRAAFTLHDASMSIVAEGEDSGEEELCLGDCCASELVGCTTLVKIVDEQGRVVSVDSRKLLGLKVADMVVIEGTAKKDESGNFVMLAKGVYVRN
jgi:hypothetical protein